MAARLSPAGIIAKWVIAPLIVALLGYYGIGPRLGKSKPSPAAEPEIASSAPSPTDSVSQSPTAAEEPKPKHNRRAKHKSKPVSDAESEAPSNEMKSTHADSTSENGPDPASGGTA